MSATGAVAHRGDVVHVLSEHLVPVHIDNAALALALLAARLPEIAPDVLPCNTERKLNGVNRTCADL